jgi:hypothetical protein
MVRRGDPLCGAKARTNTMVLPVKNGSLPFTILD